MALSAKPQKLFRTMHEIEPYYRWLEFYHPYQDEQSPYHGEPEEKIYFTSAVYNYLIHPDWDSFGSETLYIKILYANYDNGHMIMEMIGEWNDALHNDIMYLKREIIDHFLPLGINKYILIGESVFNYHGNETDYYEEWYSDVEDGWIVAMGFQEYIYKEWERFHLDYYIHFGGTLEIENWRTLKPALVCELVNKLITRRLN